MSDLKEISLDNTTTSRRDFLKLAGVTVAGVAAASTLQGVALPKFAFADSVTMEEGVEYKVNANLHISKTIVLIHKDAYFTNPTDPNESGSLPETPNTGLNATIWVEDGSTFVTVPLVNPCFMLLEAGDNESGDITVFDYSTTDAIYSDTDGNSLKRIDSITFELSSQKSTYTLGDCKEYAAYKKAPWPMSMLVPGYLTWTATLAIDFSTITAE